jgi:hypothetical protein
MESVATPATLMDRREEMETAGYTIFPSVFDATMIERLRHAIDDVALTTPEAIAAFEKNPFQGIWSIAESAKVDSSVAELLGAAGSRECLARVGVTNPRFSSGFSLSKPADSPALYWHRDWHYWDQPESDAPMGIQLFLMVYLVDTTPANGCLRVLPGSHLRKVPLDDELGMEDEHAHGGRSDWSRDLRADPNLPDTVQEMVATYPGAVDVAVKAGDLIIGDSRLYHAAYRNASDKRRTCLTMWYVDWDSCGPGLRAAYGHAADHGGKPCHIPTASEMEVALLEPLHPVYEGDQAVAAMSNRSLGDWGVGARAPLDRLARL